jgi:hypothetical protein
MNIHTIYKQACAAGSECVEDVCYVCTPCKPGTFKSFNSNEKCLPCPSGTYTEQEGSVAECSPCPEGAVTVGVGKARADDCT